MLIQKVHHVAYRCIDAKQTVDRYGNYAMLEEWATTKRAPKHAQGMHDGTWSKTAAH